MRFRRFLAAAAMALSVSCQCVWSQTPQHYYIDPTKNGTGKSPMDPAKNPTDLANWLSDQSKFVHCNDVIHLRAGKGIVHGPWTGTIHQRLRCNIPNQQITVRSYSLPPVKAEAKAILDGTDFFTKGFATKGGPGQKIEFTLDESEVWVARDLDMPVSGTACDVSISGAMFLDGHPHYKLVHYARLEDLKAQNQSFPARGADLCVHGVAMDDPRPGFGPIATEPIKNAARDVTFHKVVNNRKMPSTYLGPGFFWEKLSPSACIGNLYVRLSHTEVGAPGIVDYTFEKNPNKAPLSFSFYKNNRETLHVGASRMKFQDLVIRNGADRTVDIPNPISDITFDNCVIHAAFDGMVIGGNISANRNIKIRNSIFDGGLAPWTMRSDTKSDYRYCARPTAELPVCPQDDCKGFYCSAKCCPKADTITNNMGKQTADTLLRIESSGVDVSHSTFRRGHDGIQIKGNAVTIRHSLFEDLNDEGIRFAGGSGTKFYQNLIRQTLNPFSISGRVLDFGSVSIFRNIVDQRVPVRGTRILPFDADAPFIWRHGVDFKTENKREPDESTPPWMPDTYVYQNTFVSSHEAENDQLTAFLEKPSSHPCSRRMYVNNLHVGIYMQTKISHAAPGINGTPEAMDCDGVPPQPRRSLGNLWHFYHRPNGFESEFLWDTEAGKDGPKFQTLAALHADATFVDWEKSSRVEPPRLVNLDDEIVFSGPSRTQPYPHNDWRPSPKGFPFPPKQSGVHLKSVGLKDAPDFPDLLQPMIGAHEPGGAAFVVGANNAVRFPRTGVPTARARLKTSGSELVNDEFDPVLVADLQSDGFEHVKLTASASTDADGTIAAYEWRENGRLIASTSEPMPLLAEGDHYLQLLVRDNSGNLDTDGLRVRVGMSDGYGENLLSCPGFENEKCQWKLNGTANIAPTAPAHSGKRALAIMSGRASTRVGVHPNVKYRISGWLRKMTPFPGAVNGRISLRVLDENGESLAIDMEDAECTGSSCSWPANNFYQYHHAALSTPAGSAVLELSIEKSTPSPPLETVLFDDLRVQDQNLLRNAGFERRAASGSEDESPGWQKRTGVRILQGTASAHSGERALRLVNPSEVGGSVVLEQLIKLLPPESKTYRLSAWIKRTGANTPSVSILIPGANVSVETATLPPDGIFHRLETTFEKPEGKREMTLHLQSEGSSDAIFDDLLVLEQ
jgi:hypothetical protein